MTLLINDMNKKKQAGIHLAVLSHVPALKRKNRAHTEGLGKGSLSLKLALLMTST